MKSNQANLSSRIAAILDVPNVSLIWNLDSTARAQCSKSSIVSIVPNFGEDWGKTSAKEGEHSSLLSLCIK